MKKFAMILVALLIAASMMAVATAQATEPTRIAATSADDFIGDWELSGASILGIYMSAAELGVSAELTVTETNVTVSFDGDIGTSPWELLDDGTLKYTDPDGTTGLIFLDDDGSLSLDIETDVDGTTYTLTMYFTRVAPQA